MVLIAHRCAIMLMISEYYYAIFSQYIPRFPLPRFPLREFSVPATTFTTPSIIQSSFVCVLANFLDILKLRFSIKL